MSLKVLIVDDEKNIRMSLSELLNDQGFHSSSCDSGELALDLIKQQKYDLVFLDVKLPGIDGINVLKNLKKVEPEITVIMISGHADLNLAVKATKLGAYNVLEKPLNPEKVILEVNNLARNKVIEQEVVTLKKLVDLDYQMIGTSPLMEKLRQEIKKAAPSEGRILIYGENGTGKELVAREIHQQSYRCDKSFIKVNCAAIPKELIESELFGYERGAFTGAIKRKIGMFDKADGGTLFLDEIGDMALETQAKLLRVLQENEFQRIGGTTPLKFNIRFISATNKNLLNEIVLGTFREDLFFRLNVIPIYVPSLRERKEDIPILVRHFLNSYSHRNFKKQKTIEEKAFNVLMDYHWPGNIRELKNLIERSAIMSDGEEITFEDIINSLPTTSVTKKNESRVVNNFDKGSLKDRLEYFEKQLLRQEFQKAEGNVSRMATNLKTDRPNLHRKLKKYYIK